MSKTRDDRKQAKARKSKHENKQRVQSKTSSLLKQHSPFRPPPTRLRPPWKEKMRERIGAVMVLFCQKATADKDAGSFALQPHHCMLIYC